MARSLGVNVHWAKIKTYAIATAFVSVVGSFHACCIKNIEPEDTMSLDISDRGYVLQTGRIVNEGSGVKLLQSDMFRRAFLGI